MRPTLFLEVGPLQERHYGGVSMVTLALARHRLQNHPEDTRFFVGEHLIDSAAVEAVIEAESGSLFQTLMTHGVAVTGMVTNEVRNCLTPVALFPSVKSLDHRIFSRSLQIVHDISFLLNPEFHDKETIDFHNGSILRDLSSNDLTICVSSATADHLSTYLGVPRERIVVAHLGGDHHSLSKVGLSTDAGCAFAPYILVPGTIEPRKNLDLVLRALALHPRLMDTHRWVFFGAPGWLITFEDRIALHGLQTAYAASRIEWLRYVGEYRKAFLYRHAELTVYPSLFEGFGLPVVEAMHYGCPVVCSHSSGIPEAGGDAAFYFDPTSQGEFIEVLQFALERCRRSRAAIREECLRHAANFTWDRFARTVDAAVMQCGGGHA